MIVAPNNADKIQSVINDDLFPTVTHVSDVKQVLEFMKDVAAPLSEEQVRAILLLESLGSNKRLHGDKNPYAGIIKSITGEFKRAVGRTETYLQTIEELIPKPPKPIIMAPDGRPIRGRR
ncbi:hypothetical protein [Paenibacillus sp. FSL P2-0536]|uniref:hypothetical protein n=1 Tax=Paenibacillus sp. FSL P2-0536 TaxID=2921629 RepID=UPI004040B4D3